MVLECYKPSIGQAAHDVAELVNPIIERYQAEGYTLTLRQLYYQLVAAALIENTTRSYKRLGAQLVEARLGGLVPWDAIEDRGRSLIDVERHADPDAFLQSSIAYYGEDVRRTQESHVEVWIEKDALAGVLHDVCMENRVPLFPCKGYASISALWEAAQRFRAEPRPVEILHLGDHDPSGLDMTRDIRDRLDLLAGPDVGPFVQRIALTMDQIRQYNPPPNPAKVTDSRAGGYIAKHGRDSWELDAIPPGDLVALVREAIAEETDADAFQACLDEESENRDRLRRTEVAP